MGLEQGSERSPTGLDPFHASSLGSRAVVRFGADGAALRDLVVADEAEHGLQATRRHLQWSTTHGSFAVVAAVVAVATEDP